MMLSIIMMMLTIVMMIMIVIRRRRRRRRQRRRAASASFNVSGFRKLCRVKEDLTAEESSTQLGLACAIAVDGLLSCTQY